MKMLKIKLGLLSKIMRSKYLVVLTDKEAVIALHGVNPRELKDITVVAAQAYELELFAEKLDHLRKNHAEMFVKLMGGKTHKVTKKAPKKTVKKTTKK